MLLGSNAEHLIQRAKIPVLVLKTPPDHLDIKAVVLASDFHDHYNESINFLKNLLNGFGHPAIHRPLQAEHVPMVFLGGFIPIPV